MCVVKVVVSCCCVVVTQFPEFIRGKVMLSGSAQQLSEWNLVFGMEVVVVVVVIGLMVGNESRCSGSCCSGCGGLDA